MLLWSKPNSILSAIQATRICNKKTFRLRNKKRKIIEENHASYELKMSAPAAGMSMLTSFYMSSPCGRWAGTNGASLVVDEAVVVGTAATAHDNRALAASRNHCEAEKRPGA
ncbi:hypothetical protein C2845_PM03G30070 [Panicum miliaceum]|uniref:Uncharacterized protein n=1 Tax=Panicum miliaceum TaxID=4540 RepID=A0A3L6T6Q4_PANMI|nr:hypothetical protein C2845_PM03G30070 [Panicum miliaceum]